MGLALPSANAVNRINVCSYRRYNAGNYKLLRWRGRSSSPSARKGRTAAAVPGTVQAANYDTGARGAVTLPAGRQTLTVYQDNGGRNVHDLSFAS
jgi:hypothetical protein